MRRGFRRRARLTTLSRIITGAASGIRRATAELLAARGACIAAVDRRAAALDDVAGNIRSSGGEAVPFVFDLADAGRIDTFVSEVAGKMGRLDVLVNNAATYVPQGFLSLTRAEWQRVLDVNLTAYFTLRARGGSRDAAHGRRKYCQRRLSSSADFGAQLRRLCGFQGRRRSAHAEPRHRICALQHRGEFDQPRIRSHGHVDCERRR